MEQHKNISFALEINSLYDPEYWGYEDFLQVLGLKPEKFWDRAMETLVELGFAGFESSFGPGSYESAKAHYGSGAKFQAALQSHGLQMASGFYNGLFDDKPCSADYTGKWKRPERQAVVLRETREQAAFLTEAGARIMTIGLPMRKQWDDPEPEFIDGDFYKRLADLLHRIGYQTAKEGVRLALHPEGNSSFWLKRDIDALLALTDPLYVDFCPDTGNLRAGGSDPARVTAPHTERLSIFHWKDCLAPLPKDLSTEGIIFQKHVPYFSTTLGKGLMDHRAWMELLRDAGFCGWAVLELPAANRFAEIRYAMNYIQKELLQIYS